MKILDDDAKHVIESLVRELAYVSYSHSLALCFSSGLLAVYSALLSWFAPSAFSTVSWVGVFLVWLLLTVYYALKARIHYRHWNFVSKKPLGTVSFEVQNEK